MNALKEVVSSRLEIGDALAADLLAGLDPLRFEEAANDGDREAAFRLRYRVIVERGMSAAADFPDGIEHDDFDVGAVHILGKDRDRPIATCRLVPPVPGRRLPVEDAFGLEVEGSQRLMEWGRVVVDPDYRGTGVFMGLAARGWLSMRARGFSAAIGATPARLVELFSSLGFAVTTVGPPMVYWGEERRLIVCDGYETIPGLEAIWESAMLTG